MTPSAASDADVVGKNQMGGEKPMLLIGSPMCCIIMIKSQNVVERHARRTGRLMRNANRVSEVKHKNFVEQCVRHPEEKEMCHSALPRRWRRDPTCVRRIVSCADLS